MGPVMAPRWRWILAMAVAGSLGGALRPTRAQESPKPADDRPVGQATDNDARDALAAFAGEFAAEDPEKRSDALRRLRRVDHPTVAARILEIALKEGDVPVRIEAFRSLAPQKCAVKA